MLRMKNPAYFGFAVFLMLFSVLFCPSLIQAQTPRATLAITFNGNVVTSPQTVMTGQAVNLAYTVSGGSASGCTWQAVGVVGGFTATTQSSTVKLLTATDFKQPTLKIY